MRILLFTGGAGSMYCGSCLRDNALATELLRRGHDVVLSPLYTPTKTDEKNVSAEQIFFGGISVFLEQHSSLFRHTPRFLDRLWDSPWALKLATKRQIKVDAKSLGEMTVSMLRGERGHQAKEIQKLLEWLRSEPPFDLVNIPYSLLISLAEPLKRELKVPICCTLQGDDLFLDQLGEPHRTQSMELIRSYSAHVDLFLPVSEYYRNYMPGYLGVPAAKMRLVRLGINLADFQRRPAKAPGAPFTIGYFARVAPEKGFHVLVDAYVRYRQLPGTDGSRLLAAGYLPPEYSDYLQKGRAVMESAGLGREFEYRGETDRAGKVAFMHQLDLLSVPATYQEPKGLFLMEAMACGVPVVQPRVGAFPEIIETTGGGLIVDANPGALADGFAALKHDPDLAQSLGAAGFTGVREHYSVERMADQVEGVYRELAGVRA